MAEQASGFQISPDNRRAAWVRSTPNRREDKLVTDLVLTSLSDGKEVQLTRDGSADSPKWSPDGQSIAFTTSRKSADLSPDAAGEQLWLISPFGGEAWRISGLTRSVSDYAWVDPDTIVFSAKEDPTFYESTTLKNDKSKVIEDEQHEPPVRLFKLSIKSGKVVRLTDNVDRISDFALSPDGKRAVTIHERSLRASYDHRDKPTVYLYNLSNGTRSQILNESRFNLRDVKWSPNGDGFFFTNGFKQDPTYLWGVLVEMHHFDLASGRVTKIDLDWERGLTGGFVTTKDGFIGLLANGARNKPARFTLENGRWVRRFLVGEHAENIFGLLLGSDGTTLLYNHSTASKPTQWYRARLDGDRIRSTLQLTKINERFNDLPIARTELIRWKGALDEEVEGILYYPHDYTTGKKYPLVVMIHGGPTLVDSDAWKETYHYPHNLYTQRGAFVFAPNYHGSSNYGLKWVESIAGGKYYDLEVPDIEKGVDSLIAKGLVDPEKLGLLGWSNGSLLTIALTTRTTRYKAAGAGAGVVDWTSDWATAYFGASFNNYYFGRSPLEDPQRYVAKSPFYKLDQVRTPTIIFFGEDDRTVSPSQGWMHYRALQQMGKTDVKFVTFPDTGHSFRKLSFQRRKIDEELAWFDKYLFQTYKPVNESLKPDSPLAAALKRKNIKRDGVDYGVRSGNTLIPETVEYKGMQVGRFEVTRAQFAAFDKSYKFDPGTENYPAAGITFDKAKAYAAWLSKLTGQIYRLPADDEVGRLYNVSSSSENTLDFWAGYAVNPEDAAKLTETIRELPGVAPLLKAVGTFKGVGGDELIFDLGGNVAEWAIVAGAGKAVGGSADLPVDPSVADRRPQLSYTGFRIVREPGAKP
jgi:dipeptidyl aminopeptidase/acylaminoacyl peptidase